MCASNYNQFKARMLALLDDDEYVNKLKRKILAENDESTQRPKQKVSKVITQQMFQYKISV